MANDRHVSKSRFTFGRVNFRALVEVNNVLNQDYSVIVNYPMPGRNYRFTLSVDL